MAIMMSLANSIAGLMALPRSPLHGSDDVEAKEAEDIVDSSLLPPG
jgi:acetolactate synthase-1/3 small subunit